MAKAIFTDEWAQALITLSAGRKPVPGLGGVVGFGVGKKPQVVVSIVDGQAKSITEDEFGAHVPFTGAQALAWLDGELNLTEAYTKGDLKATGKTGDLLSALELLDDRTVADSLPRPE